MSLKKLQDEVIAELNLPKKIVAPESDNEITEKDIRNIEKEAVLKLILELSKDKN